MTIEYGFFRSVLEHVVRGSRCGCLVEIYALDWMVEISVLDLLAEIPDLHWVAQRSDLAARFGQDKLDPVEHLGFEK